VNSTLTWYRCIIDYLLLKCMGLRYQARNLIRYVVLCAPDVCATPASAKLVPGSEGGRTADCTK
jgi:hypothetical protein